MIRVGLKCFFWRYLQEELKKKSSKFREFRSGNLISLILFHSNTSYRARIRHSMVGHGAQSSEIEYSANNISLVPFGWAQRYHIAWLRLAYYGYKSCELNLRIVKYNIDLKTEFSNHFLRSKCLWPLDFVLGKIIIIFGFILWSALYNCIYNCDFVTVRLQTYWSP